MRFDILFLCGVIFFGAFPVSASIVCPRQGERPAVASDAAVQNGNIIIGTCYDPQNSGAVSQNAEQAKQYLKSIFKPVTSCTSAQEQVSKVNDAFAICAARFLKEFNSTQGGAQVIRAWNNVGCETAMCKRPDGSANPGCGGFGRVAAEGRLVVSNHVLGVAMDVFAGSKQRQMIDFAHKNPQFGVCFPIASWDPVHMVLGGLKGGERCAQVPKPCEGVTFDPSNQSPTIANTNAPQSSQGGPQQLADLIRTYTNPQRQPLINQPITQNTVSSAFLTTPTFVNTGLNDTGVLPQQSAVDTLNNIANESNTGQTPVTVSSQNVKIDASNAAVLTPSSQNINTQMNNQQNIQSPVVINTQTFTSSDLNQGASSQTNNVQSRFQTFMQYLRPYRTQQVPSMY